MAIVFIVRRLIGKEKLVNAKDPMSEESIIVCPHCQTEVLNYDEGEFNECEHVMLAYSDMLGNEFGYIAPEMEKVAESIIQKADDDDTKMISAMMEEYAKENKGFTLETLTTHGMACGPVCSMDYILFKAS